ncbi:chymotrypsin-elastase inhibitor ixodidin-like [Anopheles maculipalpis]|uniref:chymotrypsin-elastase inhibitor ixodidin-like n=1 Tax=Anopheles maculipalpis TaxID=1496333 RepID=UPI002158DC1A|nr:chymotrypsin-elastase inhibitor ixodidin-like [Anopheles maculipalpis]
MKLETLLPVIVLIVVSLLTVCQGQNAVNDPEPQPEPIVCTEPNETYDDCGPICGDRTCANQRKNDVSCRRSCTEGCFCIGGYVRNKSRKCVPSYMCTTMG